MGRRGPAKRPKNRKSARAKRANLRARVVLAETRAEELRFAMNRLDSVLDEGDGELDGNQVLVAQEIVDKAIKQDDTRTEPERLAATLTTMKAELEVAGADD